jgi:hypothetical protein
MCWVPTQVGDLLSNTKYPNVEADNKSYVYYIARAKSYFRLDYPRLLQARLSGLSIIPGS